MHKWREIASGFCDTYLYECTRCESQFAAYFDQDGSKETNYVPSEAPCGEDEP